MTNIIRFPSRIPEPDDYSTEVTGTIRGDTGEADSPLSVYSTRFFGSEHFADGCLHLAITATHAACAIVLTPGQARDLALFILKD